MDFGNYFPLYFPLLIAADNGSKRIAPADADVTNDLSSLAVGPAKRLSINGNEVRRLKNVESMGATEITRALGIARTSVYRVLENC